MKYGLKKNSAKVEIFTNPTPFAWQKDPDHEQESTHEKRKPMNKSQSNLARSLNKPKSLYIIIETSKTPEGKNKKKQKASQNNQVIESPKLLSDEFSQTDFPSNKETVTYSTVSTQKSTSRSGELNPERELLLSNISSALSPNGRHTFLTQLDDRAYSSNPAILSKPHSALMYRSQSNKSRRRMTLAMLNFLNGPKFPATKSIDLSKYDGKDEFDIEEGKNDVPKNVLSLTDVSSESLIYHALCGSLLSKIPSSVVSKVIVELKKLFDASVKKGYVTESAYIQSRIESLKEARGKAKRSIDRELYVSKLNRVESQLKESKRSMKEALDKLEIERQSALEKIEKRYGDASYQLELEWESNKTLSRFNKPSSHLIALKNEAQLCLQAHRFSEAAMIASEIEERENEESTEAGRRMNAAYKNAQDQLRNKFEQELSTVMEQFNNKRNKIVKCSESLQRPLNSRIDILHRKVEETDKARSALTFSKELSKTQIPNVKPVNMSGRLNLPPFTPTRKF